LPFNSSFKQVPCILVGLLLKSIAAAHIGKSWQIEHRRKRMDGRGNKSSRPGDRIDLSILKLVPLFSSCSKQNNKSLPVLQGKNESGSNKPKQNSPTFPQASIAYATIACSTSKPALFSIYQRNKSRKSVKNCIGY
jgi:hypothetical protein